MDAERLNALTDRINGFGPRLSELRRYL